MNLLVAIQQLATVASFLKEANLSAKKVFADVSAAVEKGDDLGPVYMKYRDESLKAEAAAQKAIDKAEAAEAKKKASKTKKTVEV